MIIENEHVISALDLSRVRDGINDISTTIELKNIIHLGQEIDLLETMRRQDNPGNDFFHISKKQMLLYGSKIGIDPITLEKITAENLQNYNLIEIDEDNIEILYTNSNKIFDYGTYQINNQLELKEQKFLDFIQKSRVKPLPQKQLNEVLLNFPKSVQKPLENSLINTKILSTLQAKENIYYSSPKLYKHQDSFRKVLEYNDDNVVSQALEFLCDNPGIPLDSISPKELNHDILGGLTISGVLDSVNLDINGNSHEYIVPSIMNSNRVDKDHLDQVKKTLANFRFAEKYAKFNLNYLTRFFESLLDRGYAGNASPIGTDYRNLEACGIISVEKVPGKHPRLWMLKKDVIEDTLNVLKGTVPLVEKNKNVDLTNMDDSVYSRMILDRKKGKTLEKVTDAIREVERGLL